MGTAARIVRDRVCPHCHKPQRASAVGLMEHTTVCKRMKDLNLVLGGQIERPEVKITYKKVHMKEK